MVRLAGGAKHEIHWLPREETFTITGKGEEVDEVSAHVPLLRILDPPRTNSILSDILCDGEKKKV